MGKGKECFKNMVKTFFPGGSRFVSTIETVENIEAMNLDAQMNAFFHILEGRGFENEDVWKLLKDNIKSIDGDSSSIVTFIVFQLMNNTDTKQSEVEARAFADLLDRKITWKEFCMYCSVIHGMVMMDFDSLKKVTNCKQRILYTKQYWRWWKFFRSWCASIGRTGK